MPSAVGQEKDAVEAAHRPVPLSGIVCQGFGRAYRLTQGDEYRWVFSGGRRSGSRYFTVLVRENDLGLPRLGLAISRKCLKLAVARNRVKRVVRARFRETIPNLPGVDVVFIGRPMLAKASAQELRRTVEKHLKALQCGP